MSFFSDWTSENWMQASLFVVLVGLVVAAACFRHASSKLKRLRDHDLARRILLANYKHRASLEAVRFKLPRIDQGVLENSVSEELIEMMHTWFTSDTFISRAENLRGLKAERDSLKFEARAVWGGMNAAVYIGDWSYGKLHTEVDEHFEFRLEQLLDYLGELRKSQDAGKGWLTYGDLIQSYGAILGSGANDEYQIFLNRHESVMAETIADKLWRDQEI